MLAKFICEHTLKWPSFWPDELRLGLGQRFPVHVYVSEAAWIFDSLSCWWTFWSEPLFHTSLSHCMIIEWAGLLFCPASQIDWLTRWPLPIKDAQLSHTFKTTFLIITICTQDTFFLGRSSVPVLLVYPIFMWWPLPPLAGCYIVRAQCVCNKYKWYEKMLLYIVFWVDKGNER